MTNEIKEIIEALKPHNDIVKEYPLTLSIEEQKLLLDYITNLQKENEDLREENKEAHDFDETMKDIKDNLIARINRQDKEIAELQAQLEMYENGVYFSSENDELQERIDKAIEYVKNNKLCICKEDEGMIFTSFVDKELLEILKGSEKE